MAGKMQNGVLDRGLHALTAFLHSSIGKADNDHRRQAIGIIHFNFDDDAFKSDHGAGKYTCKHVRSLDEAGGNVN